MAKLSPDAILEIIKRALLIWGGVCLFFIGLAGLLLPILPGIILSLFGIILIARGSTRFREHHFVKKCLLFFKNKLKNKKGLAGKIASFL